MRKKKVRHWTGDEIRYLMEHYAICDNEELVKKMGRSRGAIVGKAHELKIKKDPVKMPRDAAVVQKTRQTLCSLRQKYNQNPITETTVKMICWYTEDGDSITEIAEVMNRPAEVVQDILDACLLSGRYDRYSRERKERSAQLMQAGQSMVLTI